MGTPVWAMEEAVRSRDRQHSGTADTHATAPASEGSDLSAAGENQVTPDGHSTHKSGDTRDDPRAPASSDAQESPHGEMPRVRFAGAIGLAIVTSSLAM